jgi:hypothetical protein
MEKLFPHLLSLAASIAGNLTLDGGGIQIQFLLLRQMGLYCSCKTQTLFNKWSKLKCVLASLW